MDDRKAAREDWKAEDGIPDGLIRAPLARGYSGEEFEKSDGRHVAVISLYTGGAGPAGSPSRKQSGSKLLKKQTKTVIIGRNKSRSAS